MHNWFFKVKMMTILDAKNSTDFHFISITIFSLFLAVISRHCKILKKSEKKSLRILWHVQKNRQKMTKGPSFLSFKVYSTTS